MAAGDKRVGLHYIVFSEAATGNTTLALVRAIKKAETDSLVTNFG
jgi:hypothetical protein